MCHFSFTQILSAPGSRPEDPRCSWGRWICPLTDAFNTEQGSGRFVTAWKALLGLFCWSSHSQCPGCGTPLGWCTSILKLLGKADWLVGDIAEELGLELLVWPLLCFSFSSLVAGKDRFSHLLPYVCSLFQAWASPVPTQHVWALSLCSLLFFKFWSL